MTYLIFSAIVGAVFGLWHAPRIKTRDEKFRAKIAEARKLRATPLNKASTAS